MKLSKLFAGIKVLGSTGNLDVEIDSLSQNTLKLKKNCLFFCYKGIDNDGHDYANFASKNGAVALVVERYLTNIDLPQILVKNTRKIMAKVCDRFFNRPTKKLKFVGVTGTNGKTTTANVLFNILKLVDKNCAIIGTNGVECSGHKFASNLTTPDTVDLFYMFDYFMTKNAKYVVMEVSAHSLSLDKLRGIKYEVGIFTNLSQDHLDFFKTMHDYALAKLKFLNKTYCKTCLINADDEYGKLFLKLSKTKTYSYGLLNPSDCFAIDEKFSYDKMQFVANLFDSIYEINTHLIGRFNIYNILSAMACAKLLGVDDEHIINGVALLDKVEGRVNIYPLKNFSYAVIDFAHTPDGLEKVLTTLKEVAVSGAKIVTVFGCGGNRDKSKRAKMGKVATMLSDFVIITSDNPRYEKPNSIISNILSGISTKNYEVVEDRRVAIQNGIQKLNRGDILLIAGKGAESYQEIEGIKYPYNDFDVIRNYLK